MQENIDSIVANHNLITLERGAEELLLIDPSAVQPLYIKRGRDYIKNVIGGASQPLSRERLEKEFSVNQDLLDTLIRHRILLKNGHESSDTAIQGFQPVKKTSGISLYLLLSQSCNLGCIYCLNGRETYKTGRNIKMGEDVAFRSVERCLERLEKGGFLEIVFFGGEPMLNWPMVRKVIRHCEDRLKPVHSDKRIKYHMTSNLTVLPKDFLKWARDYQISVLCDVDGEQSIHDRCRPYRNGRPSHDDITANIEKLVKAGVDISLRATITSINAGGILEISRHHKALGVRGSAIVPLNPVNSDEEVLEEQLIPDASVLIRGLRALYDSRIWSSERLFPFSVFANKVRPGTRITMGCGAPLGNTPVVDANGDAYPCIYLMGIKRFYMGNVMEQEWVDYAMLEDMQRLLYVDHLEACRDCKWRYLCGGGCPVSRLTVLNNPGCTEKVKNYCSMISCEYTRKILELLFWELAEEADSALKAKTATNPIVAIDADQTIFC